MNNIIKYVLTHIYKIFLDIHISQLLKYYLINDLIKLIILVIYFNFEK